MKTEKEKFIDWMISNAGLRENSSKTYASKVEKRITNDLKSKLNFQHHSLFDITNPVQLKSIFENWYSVEEIKSKNDDAHNQDSCAFKNYITYRSSQQEKKQIKFLYCVEVDNDEWSETKADLNWQTYSSTFGHSNPFIAREQAFERAKSYEENFFEADRIGTDYFLKHKGEVYKDFKISVYLIHPETAEEIKIDDFQPMLGDSTQERYGQLGGIERVLKALEQEVEIFKKYNIPLTNKTKKINVLNYPESKSQKQIEIIPTPYINSDILTIPDLEDLLKLLDD